MSAPLGLLLEQLDQAATELEEGLQGRELDAYESELLAEIVTRLARLEE